MKTTRRQLGALAIGAGAATLFVPNIARAAKPRLVVVGGGPGGATVAKYAALEGRGALDVTLVEQNATHTTCFFSNLYLGGFYDFDGLTHSYVPMQRRHGVAMVYARAKAVEAGKVTLADGSVLAADAIVVAPGIDFRFDLYDGYDEHVASTRIPHAYKAGPQTQLLKKQLMAMEDGGTVLICPPPNPYRCPPGPYERASMIAALLKREKPGSKILILDAKNKYSKQALFQQAWQRFYPDMIEWIPGDFTGGGIEAVDAAAMTVTTLDGETFEGDVINMIPAQTAGTLALDSGLTGDGTWASVDPETLESTMMKGVYVLGDACANGDMPKSGFAANSQAKVVASAVRTALTGSPAFPARFSNTCWSLLAEDHGVKVGGSYEAGTDRITATDTFISQVSEGDDDRSATAEEGYDWYDAITQDVWG